MKASIIAPMKNERGSLKELVKRVSQVMDKRCKGSWELLLIDDASDDGSGEMMDALAKKDRRIRVFHHQRTRGQTGSFRTGFREAKGDVVLTIDGDLQMPPEAIPLFIDKIEAGDDVVNAIRSHRKHPYWIKLASRIYNVLLFVLFDSPVFDGASNFTAFRRRFVKDLPLQGNDHRYIIPIAMRRGARNIGEEVVDHQARGTGKSKYKALPKYLRGAPEILAAWLRIKSGRYDR